jgi:endogenous inhibitor of DNA gyrase (YacG/DUF329 family)
MYAKPRVVSCPTCEKHVSWTPDNIWRPFCSERCKLIDLGAWADEKYRVAGTGPDDNLEDTAANAPAVSRKKTDTR